MTITRYIITSFFLLTSVCGTVVAMFLLESKQGMFSENDIIMDTRIMGSEKSQNVTRRFIEDGLKTNTLVSEISLDKVKDGNVGKDGIPPIYSPQFVSGDLVSENIKKDSKGVLVRSNDEVKFYPYNILVWHEVVNDFIADDPIVITYCPLCDSSVVFSRTLEDETLNFGVSGKLYESNLLMYDKDSENLWSQVLGQAVVGINSSSKLEIYPFQVVTYKNLKTNYPDAKILSEETGFPRDYSYNPYENYLDSEDLHFTVQNQDRRLGNKDMVYAVSYNDSNVAFELESLKKQKYAEVKVDEKIIIAEFDNEVIKVREKNANQDINGIYTLWFCWATHYSDNTILWQG